MNKTWLTVYHIKNEMEHTVLWSEINLIRLSKWQMLLFIMFIMLLFKRLMIKTLRLTLDQHLQWSIENLTGFLNKLYLCETQTNQERLDRHYRSVALHTSLAVIHHQLVSPQWKKNSRSATLSIFRSQGTPFSCFPLVFLLSSILIRWFWKLLVFPVTQRKNKIKATE